MYTYFSTSITTMTMTTAIAISSKGMIIPAAIAPPEPPPVLESLVLVELVEVELVIIGGPVVANERPLYSDYVISVSLDTVAVVGITVVEVLGTTVGVRVTPNEKKIMKQ